MTYKVEILPSAWEDLKRIEDWYTLQFDVETALRVSEHILDAMERLEIHPDSGSLIPDEWLNQKGHRMVICKKQIIIYKWIKNTVYVYHIADSETEYTKLIKKYKHHIFLLFAIPSFYGEKNLQILQINRLSRSHMGYGDFIDMFKISLFHSLRNSQVLL